MGDGRGLEPMVERAEICGGPVLSALPSSTTLVLGRERQCWGCPWASRELCLLGSPCPASQTVLS